MFTEKQIATLADAIAQDQSNPDPKLAQQAARRIAGNLTAYLLNDQAAFDDGLLVGATTGERAKRTAEECKALAAALPNIATSIEAFAQNHIDGKTDALAYIAGSDPHSSLAHGPGPVVDRHTRGRQIAGWFSHLLPLYGAPLDDGDWPVRLQQYAKGEDRSHATHAILYGIARDLRVLAALSDAIAHGYGLSPGRPELPGAKFFALSILEWHDAAGKLPSSYDRKSKPPSRNPRGPNKNARPDLYGLLEAMWGIQTPAGLSRDAYARAHKALRKEGALERFRFDQLISPLIESPTRLGSENSD